MRCINYFVAPYSSLDIKKKMVIYIRPLSSTSSLGVYIVHVVMYDAATVSISPKSLCVCFFFSVVCVQMCRCECEAPVVYGPVVSGFRHSSTR